MSAESTGDYGLVGSVEWRTKPLQWAGTWVENWRAYAFLDAAQLRLQDPLPEQQSRFTLASVGIGTSFRIGQRVSGRLDFGYPLRDGPRTEKHDPRVTFSINASY
jgi:hemolysin activation/secretion protein